MAQHLWKDTADPPTEATGHKRDCHHTRGNTDAEKTTFHRGVNRRAKHKTKGYTEEADWMRHMPFPRMPKLDLPGLFRV